MSQAEIQRLDSVMISMNGKLSELSELLADVAKWADGPNKQQMLDQIFHAQDQLFARSDEIRDGLRKLGFDIPRKV